MKDLTSYCCSAAISKLKIILALEISMSDLTNYRCAMAIAKLKVKLALAVLRETAAMGHASAPARLQLDQARKEYQDYAPIFACGFEIRGEVCRALNSHESGMIIYQQMEIRCFTLEEVTLEFAKRVAMDKYAELGLLLQVGLEFVGDFTPKEIVLKDAFGSAIGLYMGKVWERPTPAAVWSFMAKSAIKARIEAATELKKMNNAEAKELLQQANYLDDLLNLSKAHRNGWLAQGKFEEISNVSALANKITRAVHA